MSTIDRQAAIDALCKAGCESGYCGISCDDVKAIEQLPAAEPEIIRCKDCVYGEQDENNRWYCRSFGCCVGNEDGSGFCADAERREKNEPDQ